MRKISGAIPASLAVGAMLVVIAITYGEPSQSTAHEGVAVAQASDTGASSGPEYRLNVNHAQTFSTMAELRAASTAIVEGTAGEQTAGKISGIPTTITKLAVDKVVWGKVGEPNIEVRQLGVAGQSGNASTVLTPGTKYLVFLAPSTGADDATDNRYLIAGDAGLYELIGDQYLLRGGNQPPDGDNALPASMPVGTANTQATS